MRKKILIAVLILAGLGLLIGGAGAYVAFAPNTQDYEEPQSVKIPRGAGFEQAVDSLTARGILDSRTTFTGMTRLTGWGGQIKAGHYRIASGTSNYDLLQKLRRGLQDPVRLTISPGSRPEVVAAVAARNMAFEKGDFLAALRDTALAAELGTDTTHLFGYMLPETYQFYWLNDAKTAVRKIKEQFDRFYDQNLAARADSLGLTKDEVINLAAIVEWETGLPEEKPRVAGVYLNRLQRGMKLDADPTVQYGLLQIEGQKRRLFYEDYRLDHPYNTYLIPGLPPGPVTNPSPSSLRAVVDAEDHSYLYMVAHPDGGHTFSRTLTEHNRASQENLREINRRRREQQARSDSMQEGDVR